MDAAISTAVIPVADLKRATEWYARLFGQAIKPERQDGGPIYWFDLAEGPGVLLDDNREQSHWERFPTFMLRAPDMDAAYRYMQRRGAVLLSGIEHEHHFFAADPERNAMIVCLP